jgi:hypothetical protein
MLTLFHHLLLFAYMLTPSTKLFNTGPISYKLRTKLITRFLNKTGSVQYIWRNTEVRSRNHFYSGKVISITYYDCVSVALGIQHAMNRCRILVSCMDCLDLPYFSTWSHKRHNFGKGDIVYKVYSLIFSTVKSEKFIITTRNQRDNNIIVQTYSCKVTFIFSDFNEAWIFSTGFGKILKHQISWKSVHWKPS